jgi:ABC-type oligopeptide transport system substrate-binding subunit
VASGSATYLFLNTRVAELSNPATRRGIALAIDRAELTQVTSSGLDQPLETIVPTGIRGFESIAPAGGSLLASTGAADPVRARAELQAGGWPVATKLDLYYANVDVNGTLAERFARKLNAVGMSVVLHPLSSSEFVKPGVGTSPLRADVDAVLGGWTPDYLDPQDFHQLFTCANVDVGLGPSNYCDPAGYDPLYASTTGTFASFSARVGGHRSLEELLTGPSGSMPAVPLFEPMGDLLVQKHVAGFVHHPSGLVDFEKVSVLLH